MIPGSVNSATNANKKMATNEISGVRHPIIAGSDGSRGLGLKLNTGCSLIDGQLLSIYFSQRGSALRWIKAAQPPGISSAGRCPDPLRICPDDYSPFAPFAPFFLGDSKMFVVWT
jgi:hypothetical protein